MPEATEARKALHELLDLLREVDERYLSPEWLISGKDDVAEGLYAVLHQLQGGLQGWFESDAEHPIFRRIVAPWRKFTGDNSDALYYDAAVRGDRTYRVRGRRDGAVYVSLTVEAGSQDGRIGGRTAGVLNDTQFHASQPAAPAAGQAAVMEQLQKERLEVLELVKELRRLGEHASSPTADPGAVASQPVPSSASALQGAGDEARQLAVAAMGGDSIAVGKLADLAAAMRRMHANEAVQVRSALWSAFDLIGTEAGKGNAGALQAIWQASRSKELQGLAVKALGQAAGLGNEEALRPLLDPETYLILRSSATGALKAAARRQRARDSGAGRHRGGPEKPADLVHGAPGFENGRRCRERDGH